MKRLVFYGHSDDCCEIDGDYREEFYADGKGFGSLALVSKSSEGQMLVNYQYGGKGVWSIGVSQVDEGIEIPSWGMLYINEHKYSVGLVIICPNDTEVILPKCDDE